MFYNILEINNYLFIKYHLNYKEKFQITKSKHNLNIFHKSNHLAISFFIYNSNAYAILISIIIKKKLPKKFLIKKIDIQNK